MCIKLFLVDHDVATPALSKNSKISYNELHGKFGHAHEECVRVMAKRIKLCVTGKVEKCEDCTIGKAKQANILKEVDQASKLGE